MPSTADDTRRRRFGLSTAALLAILAIAFLIRIVGIDWDAGRYLHPDERHIVADVVVGRIELSWPPTTAWLDPATSPLNPRPEREGGGYEGFAYGTLPVYAVDLLGSLATRLTGEDWTGYQRIVYLGRAASILLDTGTVLLTALIGFRLVGRAAGLIAAMIYATLPVAIQASHFFIVDSWMTFFLMAALLAGIDAVRGERLGAIAAMSAWFALALASKPTAAPFAGIIALAIVLIAARQVTRGVALPTAATGALLRGSVAILAGLPLLFLGEPFAFLQPDAYLDSFRTQADIQSGAWDVPFTQQYVGTTRGVYQLREATRYFLGPVAALMGLAGLALICARAARRPLGGATLLAAWAVGFTIVILLPETKFPRYTLPLAPALAIGAGLAIVLVASWLRRHTGRAAAIALATTLLLISAGWGTAFASVTVAEHPRIAASVWMLERVPPGSTTTSEIWDDRLPVSLQAAYTGEARRIDDAAINLYTSAPTLGDIALLGPALEQLPGGDRAADLLAAGRVDEALAVLDAISAQDLAAVRAAAGLDRVATLATGTAGAGAAARPDAFQFELLRAGASMTTSRDLIAAIREVADVVARAGEITPGSVAQLRDAIRTAADASMPMRLHALMADADYYVVSSDRVQRGMAQNPWRHGVPIRFYEGLEDGRLGATEVATFESAPALFGLRFPDAGADETFINYDHPVVSIYRVDEELPRDTFVGRLGSAPLAQAQPTREPEREPLTLDQPVSQLPDVTDGRWSERVTGSSWGAAIVWITMLVVLQAAALPLARTVFERFPDRGWGLARLLGIIVPATAVWWLASVGLLAFRATWVVMSLLLFALACWWWLGQRRGTTPRAFGAMAGTAEVVFWLTFFLFLGFKLVNPDSWHPYWGGEKPMEFAQINAILRSPSFPPVDPWYSQGYVNYYYFSFYLVAWLIKLTGIPAELAFNLAQPTVMAILAAGAFSVGGALGARLTRGRQSGMVSGLVTVALVSFAGNMQSAGQLIDRVRGQTGVVDPFIHWVWNPSRAIIDAENAQLITEFPYFTGLYGDLHSHVVGMPLLVLCVALALALALDPPGPNRWRDHAAAARLAMAGLTLGVVYPTNAWDLPVAAGVVVGGALIGSAAHRGVRRRSMAIVGSIASIGAIAVITALPFLRSYEALFGEVRPVRETTSLLELEAHMGGLLLVASAAVPPLLWGRRRHLAPPILLFAGLGAVLVARWIASGRSDALVTLLDGATVLVVAAIWLAPALLAGRRLRADIGLPRIAIPLLGVAGVVAVAAFTVTDRLAGALWAGIALGATAAWFARRGTARRIIALLVAGAAFTGAGVEVVYLVDDLSGTDWARMNTVFKFYNQVWVLLAIAGGTAAGVWIANLAGRLTRLTARDATGRGGWPAVVTAATAFVLLLASAYPITATGIRLDTRFEPDVLDPTLNAYAWMEDGAVRATDGTVIAFDEDRDVIDWFNREVAGTPVIAEAAFEPYRCNSSRISIGTGLPSVLGWQRHQMQQRHPEVLPQRDADLRALYASTSVEEKLAILHRYDVGYVVVGDLERVYPSVFGNDCVPMDEVPRWSGLDLDAGIATFETMIGESLEVAFESGDTVVYRVIGNRGGG